MMRSVFVMGLVGLAACAGGDVTDGTTDGGTTDDCATNPISQQATLPEPGATDVYYRLPRVEVVMLQADPSASLTIEEVGGAEVMGTQEVEEDTVTFFPDDELAPETEYSVTLSRDCGDITYSWFTNDVGNPLETDVVGKVYSLGLTDGDWVEPPGIGNALATVAAGIEVLVSPIEADVEVSFLGALGNTEGAQDICIETFPLEGASFADPYFELNAKSLPFNVTGVSVDIEDLFLSGAFAPDGSSLAGMVLEGTVDTRPLVGSLGLEGKNGVCDLAYKLASVNCEECADGSGPYCLSLRVENLNALEVPGSTLEERTRAQIDKDDRCTVATK